MDWHNSGCCPRIGEELACMNRIRDSTPSQSCTFDTDSPKSSCTSHENLLSVGSKGRLPRDSEDPRARRMRWKRIDGDRGQRHGPPDNGDRRPPPSSAWCPGCLDPVSLGKRFVFEFVLTCVLVRACMCCECVCPIPQDCGLGARAKPGQLPTLSPKQSTCLLLKIH